MKREIIPHGVGLFCGLFLIHSCVFSNTMLSQNLAPLSPLHSSGIDLPVSFQHYVAQPNLGSFQHHFEATAAENKIKDALAVIPLPSGMTWFKIPVKVIFDDTYLQEAREYCFWSETDRYIGWIIVINTKFQKLAENIEHFAAKKIALVQNYGLTMSEAHIVSSLLEMVAAVERGSLIESDSYLIANMKPNELDEYSQWRRDYLLPLYLYQLNNASEHGLKIDLQSFQRYERSILKYISIAKEHPIERWEDRFPVDWDLWVALDPYTLSHRKNGSIAKRNENGLFRLSIEAPEPTVLYEFHKLTATGKDTFVWHMSLQCCLGVLAYNSQANVLIGVHFTPKEYKRRISPTQHIPLNFSKEEYLIERLKDIQGPQWNTVIISTDPPDSERDYITATDLKRALFKNGVPEGKILEQNNPKLFSSKEVYFHPTGIAHIYIQDFMAEFPAYFVNLKLLTIQAETPPRIDDKMAALFDRAV